VSKRPKHMAHNRKLHSCKRRSTHVHQDDSNTRRSPEGQHRHNSTQLKQGERTCGWRRALASTARRGSPRPRARTHPCKQSANEQKKGGSQENAAAPQWKAPASKGETKSGGHTTVCPSPSSSRSSWECCSAEHTSSVNRRCSGQNVKAETASLVVANTFKSLTSCPWSPCAPRPDPTRTATAGSPPLITGKGRMASKITSAKNLVVHVQVHGMP
jgi:hypothetical protein